MRGACLHCALARVLRRAASFGSASVEFRTLAARSDPVWLPTTGYRLCRAVRDLVRRACAAADGGSVKLAVVDLCGKSHVEVTAVVRHRDGTTRVLSCAFGRQDPRALGRGFAEYALS